MPFGLSSLSSSYKYQPLDRNERQIRTISINPIYKEKHGRWIGGEITGIEALIHVQSLNRAEPGYQAVSYAWAKGKPFKKIEVRDFKGSSTAKKSKTLEVPEDVFDLLLHLVRVRAGPSPKGSESWTISSMYFWIDQICINQKDVPEKNSQVAMMDDIYRKGRHTIVWLGFPSADSDLALDFVRHFNWNYYLRLVGKEATVPEVQPVHPACADPRDPKPWVALRALLCRQWWSRTWTIQEAVLSGRCSVLCGTSSAGISSFAHVVTGFFHFATDHALMPPHVRHAFRAIPFVEFLSQWTSLSNALGSGFGQGGGYSIVKLLRHASTAGCTDDRDRIFALHSLSLLPDRQGIKVDYNLTIQEVMLNSFIYIIRTVGLSGLQLGKLQKTQNFGLPSWVPELGTRYADGQWLWHHDRNPWLADGSAADWNKIGGFKWTMPGQGPSNVRFSADRRTLACRGVVFDTIETVEPVNMYSKAEIEAAVDRMQDIDRETSKKRVEQLQLVAEAVRPAGPEVYPNKLLALMLTLMANRLGAQRATPRYKNPGQSEGAQSAGNKENINPKTPVLGGNMFVCHERTLVVTSKGYFGIAPPRARRGDLICILHTAHVPFVLRRMAGEGNPYYEFVGDAYVHGISEGEVFEWIKANGIAVQEVLLR